MSPNDSSARRLLYYNPYGKLDRTVCKGIKMRRRLHVIVRGEVQGVGFRAFTEREAARHALSGWVRNLRDGGVEAFAEGDEADLNAWLAALYRGPSAARVKEVLPVWGDAGESQNGGGFVMRPTADRPDPFNF